jgi:hypothetical protein
MDAELARAMRLFANRSLRQHLGTADPSQPVSSSRSVAVPDTTMRAVEGLVGPARAADFIALAAERELRARALDALMPSDGPPADLGEQV